MARVALEKPRKPEIHVLNASFVTDLDTSDDELTDDMMIDGLRQMFEMDDPEQAKPSKLVLLSDSKPVKLISLKGTE